MDVYIEDICVDAFICVYVYVQMPLPGVCVGRCPHVCVYMHMQLPSPGVYVSVHMYVQMPLCVCMCAFRGQHKISSSISLQIIFKAASVREHELAVSDNLVGQRVPKSQESTCFI